MKNKSRILYIIIALATMFIALFIFKTSILQLFSNYLIVEDDFEHVEFGFVLSGQALERGKHAAFLLQENKVDNIVCTGANQSPDLAVYESNLLESDLTKMQILKSYRDSTKVNILRKGTSTFEEAEAILNYCKSNNIKEIVVITSKFHTKRVEIVFDKKFKKEAINVYLTGASSNLYNESKWWESEYGLIALNNEYLKLLYYTFKY